MRHALLPPYQTIQCLTCYSPLGPSGHRSNLCRGARESAHMRDRRLPAEATTSYMHMDMCLRVVRARAKSAIRSSCSHESFVVGISLIARRANREPMRNMHSARMHHARRACALAAPTMLSIPPFSGAFTARRGCPSKEPRSPAASMKHVHTRAIATASPAARPPHERRGCAHTAPDGDASTYDSSASSQFLVMSARM